jgi:radical SAM/Cys-rich protein
MVLNTRISTMTQTTLLHRGSPLARASEQLRILNERDSGGGGHRTGCFEDKLTECGLSPLTASGIQVLQMNLGKLCNQTCRHCHVDAGPDRREIMTRETAEACLRLLEQSKIPTLDITGGAPEMNPEFRWIVSEARKLGRSVIDRCNLTILLVPGFESLAGFLAEQHVEIVASLPCYLEENVDRQRGDRVFQRSLEALKRLNAIGYGKDDSTLVLNLVFNPGGPSLPPDQKTLEADYRRELRARYGVEFTRLFTITNMPISRFLEDLMVQGKYEAYMDKLINAFNPATVNDLMCRTTLSVDWKGDLFDCDFNQMLELPLTKGLPTNIKEVDAAALARLANRPIATNQHCFGCTAGSGSSCQGTLLG